MSYGLSKSRILSGLQCPKRLWLEVHQPEVAVVDPNTRQRFAAGHALNAAVQSLYPDGILIPATQGLAEAAQATARHLRDSPSRPLFEGTFSAEQVLVRADLLEPGGSGLKLTEVKSSTSVKDYHLTDCAVQIWVIEAAGYRVETVRLAHVDSSFVYPGGGNYRGLVTPVEVTAAVRGQIPGVTAQIPALRALLQGEVPEVPIGSQCHDPFDCPFLQHCTPPGPEYPVQLLPRGNGVVERLLAEGYHDLRQVPPDRLSSPLHERVRRITASGAAETDPALGARLRGLGYPRHYLDFETIQFTVPIWTGTRPYEQLPFQWSCHRERAPGQLEHAEFLDTTGEFPLRPLAEALLAALGDTGPILVYSGFEKRVLRTLAAHLPDLAGPLGRLVDRLVDLLPPLREGYYHPAMKGSWSIKAVLPTVAPELDYAALGEVQDGVAAQGAYVEIIDLATPPERRGTLIGGLRRYCQLDTLALQRLVERLSEG